MEYPVSTKELLVDIISIIPQIEKKFKNIERYSKLIGFLSSKDYYNDENFKYPTLKKIEAKTGLKTYHIRKQLEDMLCLKKSATYFDFAQNK